MPDPQATDSAQPANSEEMPFGLLPVGAKFVPFCFETEKLVFRKDLVSGEPQGICIKDSNRSQYFASHARVWRLLEAAKPVPADGEGAGGESGGSGGSVAPNG